MSAQGKQVLAEALELPPVERAELVEEILSSFDFPSRPEVDALWAREAEDRIDAYARGDLKAQSAGDVFKELGKTKTP
jgi:putative addiction module component (TIGR02574 family)